MKKAVVTIIALALVLSLSMVFVACDNNDNSTPETASNTEVLGTAVAMAAQFTGAATSAASEPENDTTTFNAGVELTFNGDTVLSGGVSAAFDLLGVDEMIADYLDECVNSISQFVGENNVKVELTDDNNILVTLTYTNEETGEQESKTYTVSVNIEEEGKTVESNEYTFTLTLKDGDNELASFGGEAKYDAEKKATEFTFAIGNNTVSANLAFKAYATTNGGIHVEIGSNAFDIADAKIEIELGKFDDGSYGAKVVVAFGLGQEDGTRVDLVVTLNVNGNYNAENKSFKVSGKLEGTAVTQDYEVWLMIVKGGTYTLTCDLNGEARYDSDADSFEVALKGDVNVAKVENDSEN